MNIFVTGGAGFVGSVLCEELLNFGFSVTAFDNLLYKQDGLLHLFRNPRFRFVYGDVRDDKLVKKYAAQADAVIPLAAIVGFPACDRDRTGATAVNHTAVASLAEFCKSNNQMILMPNTNSGYGVNSDGICTELTKLSPISHYGATKCAAEEDVLAAGGISLRLATAFGVSPRMRLDLLVNDFTYKAVADGYIVLFEKDFKRNYIHVRDVAGAFVHMIKHYDQHRGQAFNVGLSDANLSKWELANKIKNHVPGFSIQVDEIGTDPDKRDYVVSNEKIEKTGWVPRVSLDAGIGELVAAYELVKNVARKYTNISIALTLWVGACSSPV